MTRARLGEVYRVELTYSLRRPLFWVLIVIVAFFAWTMAGGNATISSGDTAVGGSKAWITSEFAVAQLLTILVTVLYAFFVSVGAGMSVIRDEELRVGEVLHATPLTPGEYVWGKFLAQFTTILAVLGLHLVLMALFNHAIPRPASEVIGPFVPGNYLRPALFFSLPTLLFFGGAAFGLGVWTRNPVVVFVAPVAAVLVCGFFLWDWSPSWLDPFWNTALGWVDPAGTRWLAETWMKVDRGVAFYNKSHVGLDLPFVVSRLVFASIGIASVALAQRHFAARRSTRARPSRDRATVTVGERNAAVPSAPLATLGMRSGVPGFIAAGLEVARVELQELRSTPGLYLFIPIILIQTLGGRLVGVGSFDTPLLNTPGTMAASLLNTLTVCVALLMLFYTVESLERERRTGLMPVAFSSPVRTASLLIGKAIANTLVAVVVILAALLGCLIILLIQRTVPFDPRPFLIVWGVLLVVTLVLWTTFVSFVYAITRNRFTTYGIALAALAVTGFLQYRGHMNWVGNWDLWAIGTWTDMGVYELDRKALVLNRSMAVSLAVLFVMLTVRLFPRREWDATRVVHRLRPGALLKAALPVLPLVIVPFALGFALWTQVTNGFEGEGFRKRALDFWKQNIATWKDAPVPVVSAVDLNVDLDPTRRSFHTRGSYRLVNALQQPLRSFPITTGTHWDSTTWSMNGRTYKPEDRSRLYIFTPEQPLAPGDSVTIGFETSGSFPHGISKNGGRTDQFILPSGMVLTGFDAPTFAPMVGFVDDVTGVDKKYQPESRVYPDGFEAAVNRGGLAMGDRWFSTRMTVTVPQAYQVNATGVLQSDEVKDGRRITRWASDHPVRLFNVVAGKWAVKRRDGAEIYYHPAHTYNVEEMLDALSSARRYYSEWFTPYPWTTLRLSEFPNLSFYAQGSPTNITFSEGIGFLTKSEPKANAAFWITAHEAAHQWWGNILMPAEGPGNEVLAEGMSHYSTILLTEQVRGLRQRLAFCRQIEDSYGDNRRADGERSIMKVDHTKAGDNTVIYDKAGYVFWMLQQHLGRDAMLTGLRELLAEYRDNDDHATVHDALLIWRRHAPDTTAYDAFVDQWFRQVVVPEYKLKDATKARDGDGWLVKATIRNDGSGVMPVAVAASHGERFDDDGKPLPAYRDTRTTLTLGPGESKPMTIRCAFEPDRVVVDPDFLVLQLRRAKAQVKL